MSSEYPQSLYTIDDVKRAGETLAGPLIWNASTADHIREAFRIANNWRDAHAYPMRSVRYSLIHYMRHHGIDGVTGARLKRMQAIRRKLRRLPYSIVELQDLGGCRVILPSIADVRKMVTVVRDRTRHQIRDESDYIKNPKRDGYRSHHLMFDYRGKNSIARVYDDRRVEVQISTRLQHAWATAVEAVGLFRKEDLKAKQGSADWLRLFRLMSAEFAVAEGCAPPPGAPDRDQRVKQIIDLDKAIGASRFLDSLSNAVRWTDIAIAPKSKATYYLIKFDHASKQVQIEPYFTSSDAVASYDSAELPDNLDGTDTKNIVLVEADKIDNLKDAYPNYFGDVQLFKTQLNNVVNGKALGEYTVKPQDTVAPRPKETPNLSWLRRRIRWQ